MDFDNRIHFAPEAMADVPSDGADETDARDGTSKRFVSFWRASILGLAAVHTLSWAKPVLLPIALALMLSFVFAPIVRRMRRFGIHEFISAGLIVATLLGVLALAVYQFSGPAADILSEAPRNLAQVGALWRSVRGPVDRMTQAAEEAGEIASGGAE